MSEFESYEIKDLDSGLVAVFKGRVAYMLNKMSDGRTHSTSNNGEHVLNLSSLVDRIKVDISNGRDVTLLEAARTELQNKLDMQ